MRSLLLIHIQNARQSLKANRMRSALTMLGVTIGVASITTILALSAGATHIIGSQVDKLGGNIAVVRPGAAADSLTDEIVQAGGSGYAASTLTDVDVTAIASLDHVAAVAPLMVLQGAVSGTSPAPAATPIIATTPALEQISGLKIQDGQFLDPTLAINTAVIGPQLSIYLFGTEQAIGKTVSVKGQTFTVIGVLKRTNDPVNYNSVDFDKAVVITMDSGRELNQGASHIQQINIQSDSVENLRGVVTQVNKTLLKTHLDEVDFSVLSGDEIAQPMSRVFAAIAGASIAIAAVSLLVGGIGIMNIMLVNVVERTREIGIRKALGATNGDIVWQFLIEALVMSIGGGIAGYILGYGLAFGISLFLTFDPAITWETALVTLTVSVAVGLIFGIYPAARAARKDPIAALRQYE